MLVKATALFVFALATSGAFADPPVVVFPPPASTTVISPLSTSTAQSGQALLSQINNTLSQRRFEHQVLALPSQPTTPVFYSNTTRVVIRSK